MQSTPPPVKPEALVHVIDVVAAIVENGATTVGQGALTASAPSNVNPLTVPVTVPLMTFVASSAAFHVPVTALPLCTRITVKVNVTPCTGGTVNVNGPVHVPVMFAVPVGDVDLLLHDATQRISNPRISRLINVPIGATRFGVQRWDGASP
jgi:hypothetical protein